MSDNENIRAAKRQYHREWRKNHPENIKAAQERFWTKKAEEMNKTTHSRNDGNNTEGN